MIRKETTIIQSFPEVCRYSCSRKNETRNFILSKECYVFEYWKIKFRFLESIKIECSNCHWKSSLPSSFAKKIFKHGLKANTLIRYSKDKFLSSRALNFYGNMWRVWAAILAIFLIIVIYKYYTQPIIIGTPREIAFDELKSGKTIGEIVKVSGKVDYTLSFTKDDLVENQKGDLSSISREVYLPIFSPTDPTEYIILKGGTNDVNNVLGRAGLTNQELLKNQDYTVTGRIEKIENIDNQELKDFYITELPKSKGLTPAKLIVNTVNIQTLSEFLLRFVIWFILILFLLGSSIYLQIYIDRKILNK